MSSCLPAAFDAFERRLDPSGRAPLAVAFSGGGDSLALMLMAKAWAERAGRAVLALTVDHGLQPRSVEWTRAAGAMAERIGARFRALRWEGDKPATGLPAAARTARHRLIAEAARQAGARVVLLGHTLDDQLENALMRGEGERVGVLKEWSASPVWPQGRALFHFRPLLALRRADLRAWLAGQGLGWIEDPANDDLRHPRARARARLSEGARAPAPAEEDGALSALAVQARVHDWGGIVLPRALPASPDGAGGRLLRIAVACASGRETLPRPERAAAVLRRLAQDERFVATLGGARVEADRDLLVTREAGEFRRAGAPDQPLEPGRALVWDGRFEARADQEGLAIGPLRGRACRLPAQEKSALRRIPAAARGALPAVVGGPAGPTCPILAGEGPGMNQIGAMSLVRDRFAAACGLADREAPSSAIGRMADRPRSSYVGAEDQGLLE